MNQRKVITHIISDLQVTSDWIDDLIRRVESINSDTAGDLISNCTDYLQKATHDTRTSIAALNDNSHISQAVALLRNSHLALHDALNCLYYIADDYKQESHYQSVNDITLYVAGPLEHQIMHVQKSIREKLYILTSTD